jgi:hypothetical protein
MSPIPDRLSIIDEDVRVVKATVNALQVEMAELGTGVEHKLKFMEREVEINTENIGKASISRSSLVARMQGDIKNIHDRMESLYSDLSARTTSIDRANDARLITMEKTINDRVNTMEKALSDRLFEIEQAPAREAVAEAIRRRAADENRSLTIKNGAMSKFIEIVVGFVLMAVGVGVKTMWDNAHTPPPEPPHIMAPVHSDAVPHSR